MACSPGRECRPCPLLIVGARGGGKAFWGSVPSPLQGRGYGGLAACCLAGVGEGRAVRAPLQASLAPDGASFAVLSPEGERDFPYRSRPSRGISTFGQRSMTPISPASSARRSAAWPIQPIRIHTPFAPWTIHSSTATTPPPTSRQSSPHP